MIGSEGFLLTSDEAAWFRGHIDDLMERLGEAPRVGALEGVERWRSSLGPVPVPYRLVANIEQFLRPERAIEHQLSLLNERSQNVDGLLNPAQDHAE